MKKVALIVAGGKGVRMNSDIPKQFLLLKGTPVLMHTLEKFAHLDEIILVLPKTQIEYWKNLCKEHRFSIPHIVVEGGESRFRSVKNGLERVDNNSVVAIHDGVRPLISTELIDDLFTKIKEISDEKERGKKLYNYQNKDVVTGEIIASKWQIKQKQDLERRIGLIPIVPVKESIRKLTADFDVQKSYYTVDKSGSLSQRMDRFNVYKVQTPQCFLSIDIKMIYTKAANTNDTYKIELQSVDFGDMYGDEPGDGDGGAFVIDHKLNADKSFHDDASLLESYGGRIYTIEGEEKNIKITTELDLVIAEAIMENEKVNLKKNL